MNLFTIILELKIHKIIISIIDTLYYIDRIIRYRISQINQMMSTLQKDIVKRQTGTERLSFSCFGFRTPA